MATPAELQKGLSGYISLEETKDTGPVVLTITAAQLEVVGQGDKAEQKPVLSFKETKKKLVLNKTRCSQLAELVGKTGDPVGYVVKLYAGQEKVNGRTFDMVCIVNPDD